MDKQESKRVFLGCASDNAVKTRAKEVIKILRSAKCAPLPWWTTDAFHLGISLLHNIQNIPHRISGAIFLATPDNKIIPQQQNLMAPGQEHFIPRINVMLEFGHFMGVLGPSNVAICRYQECDLPTDLDGVKYIDMGPYMGQLPNKKITGEPKKQIKEWAGALPFAAGLSVTQVVQGYTGRWQIFGKYCKWGGHQLADSDRVELTGYADLWVPEMGVSGHGVVHGQLTMDLKTLGCFAKFRITSLMNNINCDQTGTLSFETEIFSYQRIDERPSPAQSFDDRFEMELIGYPHHSWSLHPSATEKGRLLGGFMLPDHGTAADVEATKTLL